MPKIHPSFAKKLIAWYLENKRSLPWRETKSPYLVWLSEVILQQTRVAQGTPYYLKFVKAFPTVEALAQAPEEVVLKLWQGLGYYSRARNLHAAAKTIAFRRQGQFPASYNELLALKGVGDYTASAIASICFQEPTAVVDGNVYRVLSRVFGIDTPINSTEGARQFKALAQNLLDEARPGTYNQALMEFGAQFCVPQNPNCQHCQFNGECKAFQLGKVGELPKKLKKASVRKRHFNYLVPISEDHKTYLTQRTAKGIWQQLYEFPLVETSAKSSVKGLLANEQYQAHARSLQIQWVEKVNKAPVVHKLSHQHLHTTFWAARTAALGEKGIDFNKVERYPVPVLIENFIAQFPDFSP